MRNELTQISREGRKLISSHFVISGCENQNTHISCTLDPHKDLIWHRLIFHKKNHCQSKSKIWGIISTMLSLSYFIFRECYEDSSFDVQYKLNFIFFSQGNRIALFLNTIRKIWPASSLSYLRQLLIQGKECSLCLREKTSRTVH